jgi:hypothetical protein
MSLLRGQPAPAPFDEVPVSKPKSRVPHAWVRLSPAEPTEVYETYWRFAAERQAIFFRRLAGLPAPWTSDPILARYKFTNVYRASDRVSQYLIRHVIYRGKQEAAEIFFRTILFKLFNRIDTWERLEAAFGEVTYTGYKFEHYDRVLTVAMDKGERIYSAAYIMPAGPGRTNPHMESRKHRFHLRLVEQMMRDDLPHHLADLRTMQEVFDRLRSYASIGSFLAYQFATDLNYSPLINFSERDFVVPGPGALSGIRKCFRTLGGLSEVEMIRLMAERQAEVFRDLGLSFPTLWGRPLQLIDCQNLFCEVDKYARVRHPDVRGATERTRIKQLFAPILDPLSVWYPPKWGLNERIMEAPHGHPSYDLLGGHGTEKER